MNLTEIIENNELIEIGRKAIEDVLVELRDFRISMMRGNGLVIKEKDGTDSRIIRMGPEDALRIGLKAIAQHIKMVAERRIERRTTMDDKKDGANSVRSNDWLCPDLRRHIFFRDICLPFRKEFSPIPDDGKQPSKITYRQKLFCGRCGFVKWT